MVTARQTGFISTITWNLAIVITGQATWYWGMTPTVFGAAVYRHPVEFSAHDKQRSGQHQSLGISVCRCGGGT